MRLSRIVPLCLGGLLGKSFRDRDGHDFVVVVAHDKMTAAARERAKVCRVPLDLRGRHQGDHDLFASLRGLGAEHSPAA